MEGLACGLAPLSSTEGGNEMALLPGVGTPVIPARILPGTVVLDEAFWVAAAEGAVRDYCKWHVAPIREETFALDGEGQSRVLLQTGRLRELIEVTSGGRDVTAEVEPAASGVLELCTGFARGLNSVVVRAIHGYAPEEIPQVQAVIAAAASRFSDVFGNVVASQSAGGSAVSFFAGADALMASERSTLEAFRIAGRT